MITCKFSKDELIAVQVALKLVNNLHRGEFATAYNNVVKQVIEDSQKSDEMSLYSDEDISNYLVGLRGNVKSLIRNN